MYRSKSSNRWLREHFADPFVKNAQAKGYRSRAVYKLKEIDIKHNILKPGMTVVELGAAPGSWTQYIVEKLNYTGTIIALDKAFMQNIRGVIFIQGDFQEEITFNKLQEMIKPHSVDLLLSDMAPNMSGASVVDIPQAMLLAKLALDFGNKVLKSKGKILVKLFHGSGIDDLIQQTRINFKQVSLKKPQASRARSRETYLLAQGYNL